MTPVANFGRALGAARAVRKTELHYLPACSPDFNPIEQAFAKLKAALNREDLLCITATAFTAFTSACCASLFRHAQYAATY